MNDGRPDRNLYAGERNPVQLEFAHHNRSKDMKDDYAAFTKVKTKKEMRALRTEFRVTLVFIVAVMALSGLAIAYFW